MNEAATPRSTWDHHTKIMCSWLSELQPWPDYSPTLMKEINRATRTGEQAVDDATADATHDFLKNSYWRGQ